MTQKIALFLDGGFIRKKLDARLRRPLTPQDIEQLAAETVRKVQAFDATASLFRAFYYDAHPFSGTVRRNPVANESRQLPGDPKLDALLNGVELLPCFAVRRGSLSPQGWKLTPQAIKSLLAAPRPLVADDFLPELKQKGVDMRIGLDIAHVATRRIADVIVLITGDADFVPAIKFARREGVLVHLEAMGHGVRPELKAHCDRVL